MSKTSKRDSITNFTRKITFSPNTKDPNDISDDKNFSPKKLPPKSLYCPKRSEKDGKMFEII